MLEKSTESIVDGEKDQHIDHREHQTGVDTGVKGDKGCIKLAGWMEDDVMLGRMNGARRRGRPRQIWLDTLNNMRRDARDRAGWRGATTAVARGRMRFDGTR